MIVSRIEQFKLLLGVSPKCACTTIKAGILNATNCQILEGVHVDFLKNFPLFNPQESYEDYNTILLVRDPIKRFISTILNRCRDIQQLPYPYLTSRNLLSMFYDNNMVKDSGVFEACYFSSEIRHHFMQQSTNGLNIDWDYIYNIDDDLNLIFEKIGVDLGLPKIEFSKLNSTESLAESIDIFYGDTPFTYLPKITSKNPINWLDSDMDKMVRELYEEDFKLIEKCNKIN